MIKISSRIYFLLPMVALLGLIGFAATPLLRGTDPTVLNSPLIGHPAPEFTVKDTADNTTATHTPFDPAILHGPGPVRVVNFFASWCPPCEAEHPVLEEVSTLNGATVIGINVRDLPERRDAFLKRLGNPYAAMANDPTGEISIIWGTSGTPETFIFDQSGIIRHRISGPITTTDVQNHIIPLLKKGAQ